MLENTALKRNSNQLTSLQSRHSGELAGSSSASPWKSALLKQQTTREREQKQQPDPCWATETNNDLKATLARLKYSSSD